MSTRSTLHLIEHAGQAAHLYEEGFETDAVYLSLAGSKISFEAGPRAVTLRIPLAIWEAIRSHTHPVMNSPVRGMTDQMVRIYVESQVRSRIAEWRSTGSDFVAFFVGGFIYGSARDPEDKQVRSGLKHYLAERDILADVAAAVESSPGPEGPGAK